MSLKDDRVTVHITMSGADYRALKTRAMDECCSVEALLREAVNILTKGQLVRGEFGWKREYYVRASEFDNKKRIIDYE